MTTSFLLLNAFCAQKLDIKKNYLFQSMILWKNMPRKKEMNMDKRLWIWNVHVQKWGLVCCNETCIYYWPIAIWCCVWKLKNLYRLLPYFCYWIREKPLIDYDSLKSLFDFLKLKMNFKNNGMTQQIGKWLIVSTSKFWRWIKKLWVLLICYTQNRQNDKLLTTKVGFQCMDMWWRIGAKSPFYWLWKGLLMAPTRITLHMFWSTH